MPTERIWSSRFYEYTSADEIPVKGLAVCPYQSCSLKLHFPGRQGVRFYLTRDSKEPVHHPQQASLPPHSCFNEISGKPNSAPGHAVAEIVRYCQHRAVVKQVQKKTCDDPVEEDVRRYVVLCSVYKADVEFLPGGHSLRRDRYHA